MRAEIVGFFIVMAGLAAICVVVSAVIWFAGPWERTARGFFSTLRTLAAALVICVVVYVILWLVLKFSFFALNPEVLRAALYTFGGAVWTFIVLHIQEHFFFPDDLTGKQLYRLQNAKWWLTLIGAIVGLIVFGALHD